MLNIAASKSEIMSNGQKDQIKKTIILPAETKGKRKDSTEAGLLIDFTGPRDQPFKIACVLITEMSGHRDIKSLPLTSNSLRHYKTLPAELRRILSGFTRENIQLKTTQLMDDYFTADPAAPEVVKGINAYLRNAFAYIKPFNLLLKWFHQSVDELLLTTSAIKPASFSNYKPTLSFELAKTNNNILRLLPLITINDEAYPVTDFKRRAFLLQSKNEFFTLSANDADMLDTFPQGYLDATHGEEDDFIRQHVMPLVDAYPVNQSVLFDKRVIEEQPKARIHLGELNGSFLMFTPKWQYGEFEIDNDKADTVTLTSSDAIYEIRRDRKAEKEITAFIKSLHPRFEKQQNDYFYLPFNEAEKSQWFVKAYRKMADKDYAVLGMSDLKHFRYNTNTPVFSIEQSGNGIDWFDLKIEITYGDQAVTLADLQKAIVNKQTFLLLKDGSLGAIPEEWLTQYGYLLKFGKIEKNNIRLSKFHLSLVEDADIISKGKSKNFVEEYRKKWQHLQDNKHHLYPIPQQINASLRDYQKAGFEWMCLLDEMQWGGCLADDMGLGKTLQTISFLQYLCNKYVNETHLVICPTSLIYNWENELKKFAPGLDYFIYHGANRAFNEGDFTKHKVVITSYGTLRSDIEKLSALSFGYIICDESHVIKNPASLMAKAVVQLQSRNRIIISGTPVQNNTFDLYTQMNFINPGLLGGKEFFKTEFANPIDKQANKEKAGQLRKIIFPFLLRRTKEQVAKDLPAKTEIILWCEMGEEQRKIYDNLRQYYRESLLGKIEEGGGLGPNAVFILDGLTKLRQACNAPQLIKNHESGTKESVKIQELLSELEENTGDHKVLIFSQFTGMLKLISEKMQEKNIPYLYLDGSTKAEERQQLVERFQTTDHEKIFLISLKAGGVGLTLTAADYVYLVDPWWNPAAEQQAIDRTHRIGQQQKVFAYKMICKDSVEEKILALQQKKKSLSDDLISEDTGFVKSLSAEDIDFLFS